jgi:hypothetical protein
MEEECKKMTSTANHDREANEFAISWKKMREAIVKHGCVLQPHTDAERHGLVTKCLKKKLENCNQFPSCHFLGRTIRPSLQAHFGLVLIRKTSSVSGTVLIISVSLSLLSRLISMLLSVSEDDASVST